jgi:hypothetical protein
VVGPIPLVVHGRVAYRVLIPDVPCNALANLYRFTEPGGEDCFATGLLGKALERQFRRAQEEEPEARTLSRWRAPGPRVFSYSR